MGKKEVLKSTLEKQFNDLNSDESKEYTANVLLAIGNEIQEMYPGVTFFLKGRFKSEKSFYKKIDKVISQKDKKDKKIYDGIGFCLVIEHVPTDLVQTVMSKFPGIENERTELKTLEHEIEKRSKIKQHLISAQKSFIIDLIEENKTVLLRDEEKLYKRYPMTDSEKKEFFEKKVRLNLDLIDKLKLALYNKASKRNIPTDKLEQTDAFKDLQRIYETLNDENLDYEMLKSCDIKLLAKMSSSMVDYDSLKTYFEQSVEILGDFLKSHEEKSDLLQDISDSYDDFIRRREKDKTRNTELISEIMINHETTNNECNRLFGKVVYKDLTAKDSQIRKKIKITKVRREDRYKHHDGGKTGYYRADHDSFCSEENDYWVSEIQIMTKANYDESIMGDAKHQNCEGKQRNIPLLRTTGKEIENMYAYSYDDLLNVIEKAKKEVPKNIIYLWNPKNNEKGYVYECSEVENFVYFYAECLAENPSLAKSLLERDQLSGEYLMSDEGKIYKNNDTEEDKTDR